MDSDRQRLRARLDQATADLDPPFAVVDVDAFDANAAALVRRANGKPLRVASKSVRSRELLRRVLAGPGWQGVLTYTLAEATWLVRSQVTDDALVAYPTCDRTALGALTASEELAAAITLMVDDPAQLDIVDSVRAPRDRPAIRVCLDLDASWRPFGVRAHIGVRRSPVHTAAAAGELAATIAGRPGFHLVAMMAYEAQIAGMGDAPARQAWRGAAIRAVQQRSYRELLRRRAAAVAAVSRHAELEFVNGGDQRRPVGHRGDRRLRAVRSDAVRRLPGLAAPAGGILRPPGGTPPGTRDRHGARRRLDRVRAGQPGPVAQPVAAGSATAARHRGRR